jgi:indolepyruvate ferredoxin oxidoreductase
MNEHSSESSIKNKIEILNGNELIIQGALEAGFHLYTGYPGSPLADYFNILYERKDEFKKKGLRVVIANS